MSRARGMALVAAAVLVTSCSGAARTGGAPGPPAVDPVVPTASVLPTAGQPSAPATSTVAEPTARTRTTTAAPAVRSATPDKPVVPPTAAPRTVAPPPRTAAPPKPPPVIRPGGAPPGAAVIDQVDSGLDYDGFRQAQLENCTPEGQALGCWKFALVGNAGDRVCAVSPRSRAVVPYGKTITITTLPVPADMTCADYEAGLATSAPSGG